LAVLIVMRWLLIGLLASVVALLAVAAAAVRHVRRQRRLRPGAAGVEISGLVPESDNTPSSPPEDRENMENLG
jgi:hypothetical protein